MSHKPDIEQNRKSSIESLKRFLSEKFRELNDSDRVMCLNTLGHNLLDNGDHALAAQCYEMTLLIEKSQGQAEWGLRQIKEKTLPMGQGLKIPSLEAA